MPSLLEPTTLDVFPGDPVAGRQDTSSNTVAARDEGQCHIQKAGNLWEAFALMRARHATSPAGCRKQEKLKGRAEERGSMADDQSFGGRALQISIIPWLSYPVERTARWGCGMCKPEQPFDGAECWDS